MDSLQPTNQWHPKLPQNQSPEYPPSFTRIIMQTTIPTTRQRWILVTMRWTTMDGQMETVEIGWCIMRSRLLREGLWLPLRFKQTNIHIHTDVNYAEIWFKTIHFSKVYNGRLLIKYFSMLHCEYNYFEWVLYDFIILKF